MKSLLNRIKFVWVLFLILFMTGCSANVQKLDYYTPDKAIGILLEVDENLDEVWSSREYLDPGSYNKCKNGDRLITDTYTGFVYRVDNDNNVKWMYSSPGVASLSETEEGNYLLVADCSGECVKEIDKYGNVLWSLSGNAGKKEAVKIGVDKYMVADWEAKSLTLYDKKKNVIWQNKGSIYPTSVQLLHNDKYLIVDAEHYRVIEINNQGQVIWEYKETRGKPFIARKINDNRYIIAYYHMSLIKLIDKNGKQLDVINGISVNNLTLLPDGNIGIAGLLDDIIIENDASLRKKQESIMMNLNK